MADRCTGHCCLDFSLPYAPEEIEAMRLSVTAWDADGNEALAHTYPHAVFNDLGIIAAMVQYRGERDGVHRYDCAHLAESGDCSIYDRRPRMCSEYPYARRPVEPGKPATARACYKHGCTWEDARRVRLPLYSERRVC